MADNVKLLRGNVTVLAAYPEAFADPSSPTKAELNAQYHPTNNPGAMVFNISCAIVDDGFTANVTDSETDDTRTVCDVGQVNNPTFTTYEVSLDALRDEDVTANGVFNRFFNLFKAPDRPYWIIVRIGKSNTTLFSDDGSDVVTLYGVTTDNPIDIVEDNALLKFGARFQNTGDVYINVRVED